MSSRGNVGREPHRTPRRSSVDDPVTVERLLAGDPVAAPDPRLAELLAAASAPATADELAGEPAVLAAFRAAARPHRAARPRRQPMRQTVFARLMTAKVAVAAAATTVVLAGGVALAVTGVLPNPVTGSDGDPGSAAPPPATGSAVDDDDRSDATSDRDGLTDPAAGPRQSSQDQMADLCTSLLTGVVDYRTDPERSWYVGVPALRRLVEVTGQRDPSAVLEMCATLLPDIADRPGRPLELPPWSEQPPRGELVPAPSPPGERGTPPHVPPPGEDRIPPPGIPDR